MTGRTQKSIKNVRIMTISKVLTIFLNFIIRTFFIKYLGTQYLGVNGLFTNILTILSFAELGIGNAIIFKLYKPIAQEDKEKVKTLLRFYKKVYYIIGSVVFVLGICLLPFINYFINNNIDINENIHLIFFLFLINTSVSYFFTYKRSIIIANQDEYIASIIDLIVNIIASIIKVLILIFTKNYILFLITSILFTLLGDIIVSLSANNKYRYITEKEYTVIDKEEKRNIFNDVKHILMYKIGSILSNGTDNIIISKFMGVGQVGLLSNYTMITTGINSLISSAFNSLTGSIGNLNTIKENYVKEKVYYEILYLSFVIYSIISICIVLLSNKFITIWLGNEYNMSFSICFALGFDFYIDGMRFANYSFRNTAGLFKRGRFMPLLSSISNIILSVILVKQMGVFGVLIATGITRLFILSLYDPYLLHKYVFKTNCIKFYIKYICYMLMCIISFGICFLINNCINITGIVGFIICGIIDVCVIAGIVLLCTFKQKEFNGLKDRFIKR